MKKAPPAASASARKSTPAARPPTLWRNLALVFGATTIALAVFLLRLSDAVDRLSASAAQPAAAGSADPAATLGRDLAPYAALGSNMAENNRIADLGWTPAQFNAFLEGLRSSYAGRGVPMNDDALRLREELSRRVQSMLAAENPDPLEAYFRTLRDTENVLRTASGLHYRITEAGDGTHPTPDDTIVLSLTGRLPDGTELPSLALARGRVAVRDLLPGLAEALPLLSVGGKALVYLPPALGFGDRPPPQVPDGAPIIYFVELHDVIPASPDPMP